MDGNVGKRNQTLKLFFAEGNIRSAIKVRATAGMHVIYVNVICDDKYKCLEENNADLKQRVSMSSTSA